MADHKANAGRPNPDRINLEQDYEVRDWCLSLGVTQEQLREAVRAAGPSASRVSEHLHRSI